MKGSTRIFITTVVILLTVAQHAPANVKLPAIFSDHMVLQAGANAPVWGWAEAGEEIQVAIAGQTKTTTAGKDGKWMVKLDALRAGKPIVLTVAGKNMLTINDVLVGDVWLCAGQSNMRMTVDDSKDFPQEKAAANFPKIRHYKEESELAASPREQCAGHWLVCTPDTVGGFSAAGYFFGREIHQKTGIPIGLITCAVGNSTISAWTSWKAMKPHAEFKQMLAGCEKSQAAWNPDKALAEYQKQRAAWQVTDARAKAEGKPAPWHPGKPIEPCLQVGYPASSYNGKIAPLIPYALRGGFWYQGESDAGNPHYALQLAILLQDWRTRWGNAFPFAWVQLPECGPLQTSAVEESSGWAREREQMIQALKIPHTGMAIALGTGEAANIHPKNKQEVGRRLALWRWRRSTARKTWRGPDRYWPATTLSAAKW